MNIPTLLSGASTWRAFLFLFVMVMASLATSGCAADNISANTALSTEITRSIPSPTASVESDESAITSEDLYTVAEVIATLTSSAPDPTFPPPLQPTAEPTDTLTPTPLPSETPLPTSTAEPTATPTSTSTPTVIPPAENAVDSGLFQPLTAQFSASWRIDPQDSTQAIGQVWITAFGGNGGYRYYFDGVELAGPLYEYTRPVCSSETSRLTVTASNGQSITLDHIETPPCLSNTP